MKSTLAILLATTAVVAALGLPALGAMGRDAGMTAASAWTLDRATDGSVRLASNDDDSRKGSRRHSDRHSDDDDDDDRCDDDDDDHDDDKKKCRHTAPTPHRSGPIAPPANGLISPGAAPQVRTN